jgi:uncharacterized protein YbjT (DUF2867 family)
MSSPTKNIIIFGPTGAVGSAAAIEAHRRGANVWLAMRNVDKHIPGLDNTESGYTRVHADLSKPDTLSDAVKQSGATTAFLYVLFESADHMAASFTALKSAGITYAVLLSSYKVVENADNSVNEEDFIARVHARTEIALQKSGITYTSVRPAYFNSNVLWNVDEIKKGVVGLLYPDVKFDFIAPSDIGEVCGAILFEEKFQGKDKDQEDRNVYLCGPELISQGDAHGIIARTIGREIKVRELSEEEWREKNKGMPKPALDDLLKGLRESHGGKEAYPKEVYVPAVENIRKYKEAEPVNFEEWVEAHKDEFA